MEQTVVIEGEATFLPEITGETALTHLIDGEIEDLEICGEISLESQITGETDLASELDGELEKVVVVEAGARPHYEGETTVTPSQQTQVLDTAGMIMDANIIIDPIPNNYGLITWNGSTLTVS